MTLSPAARRQVMRMGKDDVAGLASTLSAWENDGGSAQRQLPWTLDLTQIITLNAKAEPQPLHHDGGYCLWNFHDAFEHKISSVWALSEFTEEVGATHHHETFSTTIHPPYSSTKG